VYSLLRSRQWASMWAPKVRRIFLLLSLLTNLTNGEGTTPPRLFLSRFNTNGEGSTPSPLVFMHLDTNGEGSTPSHLFPTRFDEVSTQRGRV